MYDYNKIFKHFDLVLQDNYQKAAKKKAEYLDKIVMIFRQFVSKCEKEIDHIIAGKISKLRANYEKVVQYFQQCLHITNEERNLVIAEFLIKPFEKFPFTGHKNEKLFKQQYNLIEKASVLIEQTLTQSFKEDEVPNFQNNKFFKTIQNHGIGKQSLTKLRLNPQNFVIQPLNQIEPIQNKVNSITKLNNQLIICVGDQNFIEVWDVKERFCLKKFYIDVHAEISTLLVAQLNLCHYLFIGFGDDNPIIKSYRLDRWQSLSQNLTHTRKITKLIQFSEEYIISGSADGLLCLHDFFTMKAQISSPHISGIEDIIPKNTYVYILQKNSTVLQYQICLQNVSFNFRRSISAGFISMIRFPQLTTNFSGIGCHIYGLSQIEITRKFKLEQTNIINVAEMISDFIILESKQTSQFFALCVFQNSSTIKIYSLTTQEQVYEYSLEYLGQVGAAGYMPKIELTWASNKYILLVVNQSEFEDDPNFIKSYELIL